MKTIFILPVLIASAFLGYSEGAKILAVFPFPGKSHHNYLRAITDHLATKGHELTIYTPLPTGKNVTNIKEINMKNSPCMEKILGSFGNFTLIRLYKDVPIFGPPVFLSFGLMMTDCMLDNPKLAELIKSNEKYDLVILETNFIQESLLAFGHKFQAPVVTLHTLTTIFTVDEYVGNPLAIPYIPGMELRYNDKMTFLQRTHNALRMFLFYAFNHAFYMPNQEKIMRKYFNYPGSENIPPLAEMLHNVALVVVNTQTSVDYVKPWVPNVIAAGGVQISSTRQPLPKDLQKFMDNSKNGVIYVSFGSVVPIEQMPDDMKQSFLKAFGKLKQNVIWKFNADITNLPKNVKIGKWLPQHDILAHPKCLAFVTHGGFLSHQEAVYFGVPLIGVPFFGDQYINTLRGVDRGFSILLDQYNITEESIPWAVNEILSKPTYRESIKKYSKLFRDNPLPPLEKAAYWIDYVIRHKGAPHLRSEGRNLPYYQYLLLDVIAFMLLIVSIVTFVVYKTIKCICRRFSKKCNAKPIKTNKKTN